MPLIKIDNHVQAAQDRLVQQDKESINFNNFIKALVLPIQDLENEIDNVYKLRSIITSEGVQLDRIGAAVGTLRAGREDSEYRAAIFTQIEINISGGQPESIINAIRQIVKPLSIQYSDVGPAYFEVFIQNEIFITKFPQFIAPLTPAGVGFSLSQGSNKDLFVFGEVSTETNNFALKAGKFDGDETYELKLVINNNSNYTLGVTTEVVSEKPDNSGFGEIYLNRALLTIADGFYDIGDGSCLELIINPSSSHEDYTIGDFGGEFAEALDR
jgi:hypothetical protein